MTPPAASRAILLAAVAALALTGCDQLEAAGEVTTPVHVGRDARALTVAAPAWYAPETLVVLCPSSPETVGEPLAPGRATIQLPETCHSFGRFPSPTGLEVRLDLAAIGTDRRATFEAAPDWWLVLVAVEGRSAGTILQTRMPGGAIEGAASPVPAASG